MHATVGLPNVLSELHIHLSGLHSMYMLCVCQPLYMGTVPGAPGNLLSMLIVSAIHDWGKPECAPH